MSEENSAAVPGSAADLANSQAPEASDVSAQEAEQARPMNRAERRAAGKKGASTPGHGGSQRGPSAIGSQRGSIARPAANQTRGSNRGK